MTTFFIGVLTAILVIDCLALIFLVLIQLPKKEAGAGLAFGGAATDALFGSGSGNTLTRLTRYAAVAFFVLALVLSVLNTRVRHRSDTGSSIQKALQATPASPPAPAPAGNPPGVPAAVPLGTTPASAPPAEAPAPPTPAANTNK